MSLAAFRVTASRSVCLLCCRSMAGVQSVSVRSFAARTRPAVAIKANKEQPADEQSASSLSSSTPLPLRRGRPRKVAISEPPQPTPSPPQRLPILTMLLPQQEEDINTNTEGVQQHQPTHQPQPQQADDTKEEEATAAGVERDESSILDLLRPQPDNPTATAHTTTTATHSPATTATDRLNTSLPAGSLHDPHAASDELLSTDAAITDDDFARFMTEPLVAPPTFEEMERQVDSLLRLEVRGRRMFPLYMRDTLKLATLTHMRDVVLQLFPSPHAPSSSSSATTTTTTTTALSVAVTQHTLHSRLFTFLVKRGSKLARTVDERITILCPEAPAVGEKVPHPQWPEMTTVVRREFTVSRGGEFGIELEDEERVMRQGKVKMRELFSGLGMAGSEGGGGSGAVMEDGDQLVDLDSLNVDAMHFKEETDDIPQPPADATDTQRLMYESQVEARQHAVAFIKERIKQLQKQRQAYVTEGRAAVDGGEEENARTREGGTHVLAVVYRFDGEGEEFEVRYPLSKRDVERMQLFEEADDADSVIPMNNTAAE